MAAILVQESLLIIISVTFSIVMTKHITKATDGGGDVLVHSFEGTVHYSGEGIEAEVVGSWSHCIQDQEAEINLVLSSLPLTQSGILPHEMVQLAQSRNSITEKPRGLSSG